MEDNLTIKLRFKSEEDKRNFLGGLSDGFGENYCCLNWDDRGATYEEKITGEPFYNAGIFDVTVFDNET